MINPFSQFRIKRIFTKTEEIRSSVYCFEFNKTVERVTAAAMTCFKNRALYILPLVIKLTRSKGLAEGIINGAFSGLVLGVAFIVLGIPTNNFALNCLSGRVSCDIQGAASFLLHCER